jgi:hypothetical protein
VGSVRQTFKAESVDYNALTKDLRKQGVSIVAKLGTTGSGLPSGVNDGDQLYWDLELQQWIVDEPFALPEGTADGEILVWEMSTQSWILGTQKDYQTLSINGQNLSISDGNTVALPLLPSGNINETLRHNGTDWVAHNLFKLYDNQHGSFEVNFGAGSINYAMQISRLSANQLLSLVSITAAVFDYLFMGIGSTTHFRFLSDGTFIVAELGGSGNKYIGVDNNGLVKLMDDPSGGGLADGTANNQIYVWNNDLQVWEQVLFSDMETPQDLSILNDILTITNKVNPTEIDLSEYIQDLSLNTSNRQLSISKGSTVTLFNDLQSLSINGFQLTLSDSNTVTLPSTSLQYFEESKSGANNTFKAIGAETTLNVYLNSKGNGSVHIGSPNSVLNSSLWSAIVGGITNRLDSNARSCVIVGGNSNDIKDMSTTADACVIIGGNNNDIKSIEGSGSVIVGGSRNEIIGNGIIIGGTENELTSGFIIGTGSKCLLGMALGAFANSLYSGGIAKASYKLNNLLGSAQKLVLQLGNSTTDDTWTEIVLGGQVVNDGNRFATEYNSGYSIEMNLNAMEDGSPAGVYTCGSYQLRDWYILNRQGQLYSNYNDDDAVPLQFGLGNFANLEFKFTFTNEYLKLWVKGIAAKTFRWHANLQINQIKVTNT